MRKHLAESPETVRRLQRPTHTFTCIHHCEVCGVNCPTDPTTSAQNQDGTEWFNTKRGKYITHRHSAECCIQPPMRSTAGAAAAAEAQETDQTANTGTLDTTPNTRPSKETNTRCSS